MKHLLLTLLAVSCATAEGEKRDPIKKPEPSFGLLSKADAYGIWATSLMDENGWLPFSCDGVGFNSLYYAIYGGDEPLLALDEEGRLWRHWKKDCLATKKSKSTISADMVVMWLVYVLEQNKLPELEKFISKSEKTGWKIGDHDGSVEGLSRIHLVKYPQVISLLYKVRKHLGGKGHKYWEKVPQDWLAKKSYPGHILAWRAWIVAKIQGKMPNAAINALKKQVEYNPKNALYLAMISRYDANYSCPEAILLLESLFPSDRLPTNQDRCSDYLWQRDLGPDYEPCGGHKAHTGLDLIVATAICEGRI